MWGGVNDCCIVSVFLSNDIDQSSGPGEIIPPGRLASLEDFMIKTHSVPSPGQWYRSKPLSGLDSVGRHFEIILYLWKSCVWFWRDVAPLEVLGWLTFTACWRVLSKQLRQLICGLCCLVYPSVQVWPNICFNSSQGRVVGIMCWIPDWDLISCYGFCIPTACGILQVRCTVANPHAGYGT